MGQRKKREEVPTDLFGNPIEDSAADPPVHISPEMERYREYVSHFTVEQLQRIRKCLGFDFKTGNKDALVSALLRFFSWLEQEDHFQEWFAQLPEYLSFALVEAAFTGYVDAGQVETAAGKPVSVGPEYYDFYRQISNPKLRLGLFELYSSYGRNLLIMPPVFRRLIASFLPKPPSYAVMPIGEQEFGGWTAEETLSESMSLLFKSIGPLISDKRRHEKLLRRGLNKTDIKELRKSSAFPAFPVGAKTGIDPIELITGMVMIDPSRMVRIQETDVRDFIRDLVTSFFTIPESGRITSHYLLIDSNFEFSILCPHLSRGPGARRYESPFHPHPSARSIFYQLLTTMAQSRMWYDMDETANGIRMQALPFSFLRDGYGAADLMLKGEGLDLPEGKITLDHWENGFVPDLYLSHYLITKPLLKSYCYLMASLGLLEIQENEPEDRLSRKGKRRPIAPSDGLSRARVTPFGAWCLGVSPEKPELREVSYEAIADRELPLVTYRGQSLECKVFLERIGDPIGEDRFRISEASFIRDCQSPADIDHRIDEFHRLIAREPAGHWEGLFARVRERARLFDDEELCVMIQLPPDRELRRVFLEDKKVAPLVVRAEGGRIAVAQRNYKKLRKLLEEYGVLKGK
jgi:hypothetical protein